VLKPSVTLNRNHQQTITRYYSLNTRRTKLYQDKKAQIKEAIRQLHAGVPPEQVKEKFRNVLEGTDSLEIAKIEEELAKEGMKRDDMRRLCDVHMAIFKEQLEKQMHNMKPSQPISILMEEHKILLQMTEKLTALSNKILKVSDMRYVTEEIHQVEHVAEDFTDAEKHYVREENVLFPIVEKHGVTEPPAIMWMEHDQIREQKKQLHMLIADLKISGFDVFKQQLWETAKTLSTLLSNHFYKENNILFPAAMSVVSEPEWVDVRREFDEIGYCCFTPPEMTATPPSKSIAAQAPTSEGVLSFETGNFKKEQLEAVLNTLPVDITFVDANDTVQYFNKPEKRFFVRTKAVIGRKVAMCHPQKSLHIVGQIVESFKTGKKNSAEFWITMNGRFLLIRFFAVRDNTGKYLGAIEVVQDLTDLKKLEGERRLLDWTD
jgi:PAS domain S-box-containing protein